MKVIRPYNKEMDKIYNRNFIGKKRIEEKVRKIIEDVNLYGDDAIIKYTKKFDKVKLTHKNIRVSTSEINGAYQNIDAEFITTLKMAIQNVTRFYRKQIRKPWKIRQEDGIILKEIYSPLDRVGIYIPAGTAPLVSTVYMTVLPAQIAGVKNIVLVTPPNKHGSVDPHILVVANLLKVEEIYKVGGAQAIAALAFGTRTIPKVDKIIGPGNAYVIEAKRQVFGHVDIEMLPGPSEVVIIANQHTNLSYIKADLAAQAEHHMGTSILITTSKAVAKDIKKEVARGYIILVKNLNEAIEVANRIAPEHLQLMVKDPGKLVKKVKNAGSVFIGPYTPVSVGDYIAGPSHVLPTGGTARFFSGLGIDDFMKRSHIIFYTKKALEKVRGPVEKIAGIEGLTKHVESVRVRF